MSKHDNPKSQSVDRHEDRPIRWNLILFVVAIWSAYTVIAFYISRDNSSVFTLLATLGALTACFTLFLPTQMRRDTKVERFLAAHKRDLRFVTIGFSLATIQAALFGLYFIHS